MRWRFVARFLIFAALYLSPGGFLGSDRLAHVHVRSPGAIAPGAGLGAIPPMGVNRPSPLQQPQLPGSRYGLSPGGGAQLAVDRLDVRLDGQGRKEKLGGDLGVLQMGG